MNFDAIPPQPDGKDADPAVFHAIVETPRGVRTKYAYDPEYGVFRLASMMADGLTWPFDYGFIPQTLADDGDPLDVLIMCDTPSFTGCLLQCRILGAVRLAKNGMENDRIIAAPVKQSGVDQPSDSFDDIDDVPKDTVRSICRFLVEYSEEEGNKIDFKGVKSKKKALSLIEDAHKAYKKKSD